MISPLLLSPPSDTWYTQAPDWGWLIVVYFFLGGIAGGAAFLSAMFDLFGAPEDRPMARLGYVVAFIAIVLAGPLLIVDLHRPERFWHQFIASKSHGLIFKWWSPISYGSWAVGLFGVLITLAFVGTIAQREGSPRILLSLREGMLGRIVSVLTGLFGLFVAGYTGILLAATNRPLWADTTLLGLLFLLSGVSAAAAVMTLLGRRTHPASVHWLNQMDAWTSLIELAVLIVLALSLGSVAREVWGNGWGVLLVVGVAVVGLLLPLLLHWRPRLLGNLSVPSAAVLVIVGSFLLRTVIVLSSQAV
jgi:protein NrfD